jgi:hypothetical protein
MTGGELTIVILGMWFMFLTVLVWLLSRGG